MGEGGGFFYDTLVEPSGFALVNHEGLKGKINKNAVIGQLLLRSPVHFRTQIVKIQSGKRKLFINNHTKKTLGFIIENVHFLW